MVARSARILAVDDEPALLSMLQQYLSRVGYEVITAAGAERALRLFREQSGRFDLVLADITMPSMSGEELAAEILGADIRTPVILCSGYARAPLSIAPEHEAQVRFLQKPFLPRTLLQTVQELLG